MKSFNRDHHPGSKTTKAWLVAVLGALLIPGAALASPDQEPSSAKEVPSGTVHAIGLSAGGSEFDAVGELEYQMRRTDGWQLGLSAGSGWLRQGYIAGFAVEDGTVTRAELSVARRIYRRQNMEMVAHLSSGMRLIRGAEGVGADSDSNAILADTGLIAYMSAGERSRVHAGVILPFSMEIAPEVMNDINGALLTIGGATELSDAIEGFATLETGGIFGSDGDAGKYLTRATIGARVLLGRGDAARARARESLLSQATENEKPSRAGPFVAMEWRVLNLAGHLSHGPALQAGVVLFERLKLGIAMIQRPGTINPKTFDYQLPEGMTYRGQSNLSLRSDGSIVGLMVSPILHVPRLPLQIEVPVMVGMAGFGFYLTDDNRETPDGRRVSEWENELLMGQDSAFSLAVDVGIRAAYDAGWWQPYIGAHYTATPGYEATLADDYGGFSFTAGVQIGAL